MATPFLRDLQTSFPHAKISLLMKKHFRKILQHTPGIEAFYEWPSGYRETGALIRQLRKISFDRGYLLTNSFSSALFFFLLKIKERIGYARDGRRFLLTQHLSPKKEQGRFLPVSMVDYYQDLLKLTAVPLGPREVRIYYSEAEREEATLFLKKIGIDPQKPFVLLNPGAAFGSAKCWPPSYFAELGDRLVQELVCQILILCGPDPHERQLAQDIQKKMQHLAVSTHENIITLSLLKPVVAFSSLLITNDSGPRHYATALRVPSVTIFGSTHQQWTDYDQPEATRLQKEVPCGPCMQRICPEVLNGRRHLCMELVTPEEVFQAAKHLFFSKKKPHEISLDSN